MSYRSCIRALALAGVILTPTLAAAQTAGKAPPPPAPQKVDDATLDSRVEARLKADAALKKDTIDVAVNDGVVTLTGTVHSRGLRTRAERLAKIAGVSRVDNKLEVETAATAGVGEKIISPRPRMTMPVTPASVSATNTSRMTGTSEASLPYSCRNWR